MKSETPAKKKKTAHAYFGRLYFFQVFWRENVAILTRCYLQNRLKKNWRMRIISARIFTKFFGGKIETF